MTAPQPHAPTVPLGEALRFWLKLGCISFGGPAGQIAVMHRELVEERRWISERRFLHALNYCMLLPGPEAQQLATYLGWLMHRTWGGIAAGVLFVLPSLFILIALSWIYMAWGHTPLVAGLFYGIKPAVAAIVLHAVWRIGSKTLRSPRRTPLLWLVALGSFAGLTVLRVPFPWLVLGAALAGWLGARWWPAQFGLAAAHAPGPTSGPTTAATSAATSGPLSPPGAPAAARPGWLIDDHTPTPAHARFSRRRLLAVVGVGALLWLLPMGVLMATRGAHDTLAQMGWFFTKAALMTFGGAYAVLPYVFQGAVEQFQWLSSGQMMDGLALGETTPGPLIMVVAYVGFVGGWARQVLGPELLPAGAALAAAVVTWFTFLPSFVFILAGGPLVEATHGKPAFTAPLTAITAAVVGVIASLALFFIAHIARPAWTTGTFGLQIDVWAVALMGLAALALFRLRVGVITVIAGCAILGAMTRYLV